MRGFKGESRSRPLTLEDGFLFIEVLISGLIIATSIAASMYLFRVGFDVLHRAKTSNILASKVPIAVSIVRGGNFIKKKKSYDLGDGVTLKWKSKFIRSDSPIITTGTSSETFEVSLYKVTFTLSVDDLSEAFEMNVFNYKRRDTF
ncbi:MAG: hypothetical protein L3V56_00265 [Candidatus Magnetoovum sp. WYHC-5]|nr:hypothetical protein [Candidatus Magnetoovum sp. WYHC-5]